MHMGTFKHFFYTQTEFQVAKNGFWKTPSKVKILIKLFFTVTVFTGLFCFLFLVVVFGLFLLFASSFVCGVCLCGFIS